ncbi:MAG: RpoL/Rpb11 RNA polymerase subunit family protein [Thermoplasmata archaeon]|nr:RpoL/Rpb11 RNA polymerase subunit family protein [Thermoplasmata archaeon]
MELRILEKEKKTLTVEVVNPDDTVIYPLISHLLKDTRVADARYIVGHPFLDKPTILVRVKKENPEDVLREVAEGLASQYGDMKKQVATAAQKGK